MSLGRHGLRREVLSFRPSKPPFTLDFRHESSSRCEDREPARSFADTVGSSGTISRIWTIGRAGSPATASSVAEHGWLPAIRCCGSWRQTIAAGQERSRRKPILIVAALCSVPCAATLAVSPPMLLLWNVTSSTPRGLYQVYPGGEIHRGDSAIAALDGRYGRLAAKRGYLPVGVPLVKRVAAIPGDRICARGATVRIDGKVAALRKRNDSKGRKLPAWSGCEDLSAGEYLLLGESRDSFDGRYFGPTRSRQIVGRAVLLWRA